MTPEMVDIGAPTCDVTTSAYAGESAQQRRNRFCREASGALDDRYARNLQPLRDLMALGLWNDFIPQADRPALSNVEALMRKTPISKKLAGERKRFSQPLFSIIQAGDRPHLVQLMLEAGADVNATLEPPCSSRDSSGLRTLLFMAATCGRPETLEVLLLEGANPNTRDGHGDSPAAAVAGLAGESRRHQRRMFERLLMAGAEPNADTLQWVVARRQSDLLSLLLRFGADVHAETPQGHGLLHTLARVAGHGAIVDAQGCLDLLLGAGIPIDATDREGLLPIQWAMTLGHFDFAAALLERGADPKNLLGKRKTHQEAARNEPWIHTLVRKGNRACSAVRNIAEAIPLDGWNQRDGDGRTPRELLEHESQVANGGAKRAGLHWLAWLEQGELGRETGAAGDTPSGRMRL